MFGDYDGIVVVPKAIEDEAFGRAFHKATSENWTAELLQCLMPGEIYERYGVL